MKKTRKVVRKLKKWAIARQRSISAQWIKDRAFIREWIKLNGGSNEGLNALGYNLGTVQVDSLKIDGKTILGPGSVEIYIFQPKSR